MNNTQDILTVRDVFGLKDLNSTQKLVFCLLYEMKLKEEKITARKIASYCNFCDTTVQRAIISLAKLGYVKKENVRQKGKFFVKYEITDKAKTSVLEQG